MNTKESLRKLVHIFQLFYYNGADVGSKRSKINSLKIMQAFFTSSN